MEEKVNEKVGIDYNEEVNNLSQGFWKPEVGVHKIKVLTEPTNTEYRDEEKGTVTPQIEMSIELAGEVKTWTVSKGKTSGCLFGQLMILGKHFGFLKGQSFEMWVKKIGLKNDYTIPLAGQLEQKEEKVE